MVCSGLLYCQCVLELWWGVWYSTYVGSEPHWVHVNGYLLLPQYAVILYSVGIEDSYLHTVAVIYLDCLKLLTFCLRSGLAMSREKGKRINAFHLLVSPSLFISFTVYLPHCLLPCTSARLLAYHTYPPPPHPTLCSCAVCSRHAERDRCIICCPWWYPRASELKASLAASYLDNGPP